jgi:hypothetical protein
MPDKFTRGNGKSAVKRDANIDDYRHVLESSLKLAQAKSLLLLAAGEPRRWADNENCSLSSG